MHGRNSTAQPWPTVSALICAAPQDLKMCLTENWSDSGHRTSERFTTGDSLWPEVLWGADIKRPPWSLNLMDAHPGSKQQQQAPASSNYPDVFCWRVCETRCSFDTAQPAIYQHAYVASEKWWRAINMPALMCLYFWGSLTWKLVMWSTPQSASADTVPLSYKACTAYAYTV